MIEFLAVIGGAALFTLGVGMIMMLYHGLSDLVDNIRRNYRIRHRFDKPPTAKCYCVDCVFHDDETKRCYRFGETTKEYRCTADNWFCWEATPRKKDLIDDKDKTDA